MIDKFLYLIICIYGFYFIGNISALRFGKYINIDNQLLTSSENIFIGIFLFGSYTFIFNFFYKIDSIQFFIILTILIFLALFTCKKPKISSKQIKYIFFFTIISFPITLTMDAGYDAGLYHVAHQKLIREEKIIFGLSNLHNVLGFSSFYEYLAAPTWVEGSLKNLPNIQIIFYICFFLFLYERSKNYKNESLYILLILITLPFWFRYASIKWGLVDFPFGIVFFLSVFYSFIILHEKNFVNVKHFFSILIILNCLTFFLKPGGFVIGVLSSIIIFFILNKKIFSLRELFKILTFPFIIVFLWIIRGFINTSCFLYPFSFTCIDTNWGNAVDAEFNWQVTKEWGKIIFDLIQLNTNLSIIYILIGLIIITFLIINLHNLIANKKKINFKYIYFVIFFVFVLQLILFNKSVDFSRDQISFSKILTEINYSIFVFGFFYLILVLFFSLYKFKKNSIDLKYTPFLFSIFVFIAWMISSPIPRLGFSFIGSIFLTFLCLLKKENFENINQKKIINFSLFLICIISLNYSFFSDYKLKKFHSSNLSIPEIKTISRNGFGVKPVDGDQCWDVIWCSPLEPYEIRMIEINKYKFLLK